MNPFNEFWKILNEEGFTLADKTITPELPAVLSTCDFNSHPNSRVLLIKKFIDEEFFFFTNKNSEKGLEISNNPWVSLCFFFAKSNRQIRIRAKAFNGKDELAEEYFNERPHKSKAGTIISLQSKPLSNYEEFVLEVETLAKTKSTLTRPESWVCYGISPESFEFWEGAEFRLNKRALYSKIADKWEKSYLYP